MVDVDWVPPKDIGGAPISSYWFRIDNTTQHMSGVAPATMSHLVLANVGSIGTVEVRAPTPLASACPGRWPGIRPVTAVRSTALLVRPTL